MTTGRVADLEHPSPDPSFPTNQHLKSLREQANLSQQKLSELTGIGLFLIDSIEQQKIDASSVLPIGKISRWKHCCNREIKRTQTKLIFGNANLGKSLINFLVSEPAKQALLLVTLAIFTVANFSFIGDPVTLDRIVWVTFFVIAIVGRNNPQVLIIALMMTCVLVAEDVMFSALDNFSPELTVATYMVIAFILYKLRHDSMFVWASVSFVICISAELYWYTADYDGPLILWYMQLITANLAIRFGIGLKSIVLTSKNRRFKENHKLDHHLLQLHGFTIILQLAMIVEYLLRHIFNHDIFVLYNSFSQINQTLNIIYVMMLAYELKRTIFKRPAPV